MNLTQITAPKAAQTRTVQQIVEVNKNRIIRKQSKINKQ